jgi:hypothetical protein
MKTYKEYKTEICPVLPEKVEPVIQYYAYKKGQATIFDTWDLAHNHSKLVEKVVVNQTDIDAYYDKLRQIDNKVFNSWYSDLKEEFKLNHPELFNLSEFSFDVVYEKAYDRGHSAGMDEVYCCFKNEAHYLYDAFRKCKVI